MTMPAFLCDAMLGRLARDLRLLGYDTAYAGPEETDGAILARARRDGRVLLTNDRALAARAGADALLLAREDELEELVERLGLRPRAVDFLTRCTECGARLVAGARRAADPAPAHVDRVARCAACGHVYWEGSHVAAIRARLERFLSS